MSAVLRVVGATLPIPASAFVLTRWTLISGGFFWYLVLIGFGSGILLRSWWALLLVPVINLGSWVVPVIVRDKQFFGGDFTLISGIFVLLALHILIALGAAISVWAGKSIEMRIPTRADQY